MELVGWFVDLVLHLDRHLAEMVQQYGTWTYGILCLIVFCETGLVVTPFLPGDSLLFAAGALAGTGSLNVWMLYGLLWSAGVLGDNTNYFIGRALGPRIFRGEKVRFLNRKHLDRTHQFFERYGAKTIVIARFVPIVRTFAPFVAGVGTMRWRRFVLFSVLGNALWVGGFVTLGYFFGNLRVVQEHFSLAVLAVIAISLVPGLVEYARHRREGRRAATERDEKEDSATAPR